MVERNILPRSARMSLREMLMFALIAIAASAGLVACDTSEELVTGQLMITDTIVGTGIAAESGDSIRIYYVLQRTDDDQICDSRVSSGGANEPLGTRLGVGRLIEGFDQGMVGAREGGRRVIIVPPNLGYGLEPPARQSCIRQNEFLMFTVDLVEVIEG